MTSQRMLTNAPASKVNAATVAAALTSLLLYALKAYVIKDGADLPEPVQYAIGVLITAAVTFGAGYLTPPAKQDQVIPTGAPPANPSTGIPPA